MKAQKKQNTLNIKTKKRATKAPRLYSLVFFLFLLPQFVFSQLTYDHWMAFRQTRAFSLKYYTTNLTSLQVQNPLVFRYKPSSQKTHFKMASSTPFAKTYSIPSYLDFQELGWFCTFDLKLDKTMKLPLRFRLGTLDVVNRKEGYYD